MYIFIQRSKHTAKHTHTHIVIWITNFVEYSTYTIKKTLGDGKLCENIKKLYSLITVAR